MITDPYPNHKQELVGIQSNYGSTTWVKKPEGTKTTAFPTSFDFVKMWNAVNPFTLSPGCWIPLLVVAFQKGEKKKSDKNGNGYQLVLRGLTYRSPPARLTRASFITFRLCFRDLLVLAKGTLIAKIKKVVTYFIRSNVLFIWNLLSTVFYLCIFFFFFFFESSICK